MPRFVPIIIKVSGNEDAEKAVKQITNAFKQMPPEAHTAAQSSSSSFSKYLSAEFFGSLARDAFRAFKTEAVQFINESIRLAQDLQNALLGVGSIAAFKGIDRKEAQDAVNNLALVRSGIISVADASTALKNLLQAGFGLKQSITLIERFGDTAAFGKQAALSYGEAIRSATEGIKNQNSILVDNAGITKNLEVLLKERGFTMQDLSDKVKGAAAREALYQGILAESAGQLGDAAKLTDTYTGALAAQDKAYQDLQREIGQLIITNPKWIESTKIVTETIQEQTQALADERSESAKFTKSVIDSLASIKAELPAFGAFMFNAAKAVFYTLGAMRNAFLGSVIYAVETVLHNVQKGIADVINFFIRGINSITAVAKLLPTALLGTAGPLQQVPHLTEVQVGTPRVVSSQIFRELQQNIDDVGESLRRMARASDEGVQIRERLNAAERRGSQTTDSGLLRATEIATEYAANQAARGGSGRKGASDSLRSLGSAIPLPTPSDPQLRSLIESYAATFGIPLWVAFAQIWKESRFNPNALSGKGARGLTQITKGTAASYGIPYGELNDPRVALSGWGKIMSALFEKYQSWEFALLAYHQGEGPVDRLVKILQAGGGEGPGGFQAAARRAGVGPLGRDYLATITRFKNTKEAAEFSPFAGLSLQQISQKLIADRAIARIPEGAETDLEVVLPRLVERHDQLLQQIEQREDALNDRRADFNLEYQVSYRDMVTEIGHLELDLAQLRRQNADDQFTEQRRLLGVRREELDLERQIQAVQDEIATGPYNQSLRIQLALLEDIADIRRRDEEAIIDQNRAQLELADAEIFHAEQARSIVLRHLADSRSQTEVFAHAIVDAYDAVNDVVLRGVQKITGGIRVLDQLLAGLITRLTNRLFQKLLDFIIPPGSGGGSRVNVGIPGASGGGIAGGFFNALNAFTGGGFRPVGGGNAGSGFSFGNFLSPFSSLTAPTSLSAATAQQAAQQSALSAGFGIAGGVTAGAAGAAASTGLLAQLGPTLGALAPILGLGVGAQLGGQSRFGQVLGGAGGLLGGGLAATFLAPKLFAAGGAFGSLGPGIAAFLTNPFTIAAAGALLVGAYFLSRNARRRQEEKIRNEISHDTGTAIWQLIGDARNLGLSQSLARWNEIQSQYFSRIAQIKDSKTRRHAELQWQNDFLPLKKYVEQRAKEGDQARLVEKRLVPEFSGGLTRGLVPYMGHPMTLIKVRPTERIDDVGLMKSWVVPGVDQGVDSVLTLATPKSRVLTRQQQAKIPGFANGTPDAMYGGGPIELTINLSNEVVVGKDKASEIVVVGAQSSDGRKVIAKVNRSARLNRDF